MLYENARLMRVLTGPTENGVAPFSPATPNPRADARGEARGDGRGDGRGEGRTIGVVAIGGVPPPTDVEPPDLFAATAAAVVVRGGVDGAVPPVRAAPNGLAADETALASLGGVERAMGVPAATTAVLVSSRDEIDCDRT